jgi:DNA replication protein DnaC
VPFGHPDFGRLYACQCKLAELEQKRAQSLRQVSNLEHLGHMTFDSFIPEGRALNPSQRENLRRAYEHALSYARTPQGWLLFRGGYGCGKTHLAAAIANYRLRHGYPALFVVVPDLLDRLRAAYSPTSSVSYGERFEEIRSHPLLILDDLGTQSNTPWADEKLFQIFNYRYNAKLPTVVTTNYELEEIEIRIRSRLTSIELVHAVPILAPDYRASGIAEDQSELSSLGLHAEQTFATFNVNRDGLDAEEQSSLRIAHRAAQGFADSPADWIVFTGTYGCGKTHLAAAIANHRVGKRQPALFVTVPDLLDHLRATFSPQSTISYDKLFEQVRRTPLLILDDLGTESATAWAREKLYQLFNHRYNARLPTVITTAQRLDELDPRLRSRLLDQTRCQIYGITAPAYSGPAQPRTRRRRRSSRS